MKINFKRCWSFRFRKGLPRRCYYYRHIYKEVPKILVDNREHVVHVSKGGKYYWLTPLREDDLDRVF